MLSRTFPAVSASAPLLHTALRDLADGLPARRRFGGASWPPVATVAKVARAAQSAAAETDSFAKLKRFT